MSLRERTFERLKKSINGEALDAHGVFNFYTYPFYHEVTKVPLDQYFSDPKLQLDIQVEVLDRLEGVGNPCPDVGSVAESNSFGAPIHFDAEGFISVSDMGIEDEDDVAELNFKGVRGGEYMNFCLETLEYMVGHCPDRYRVNPPIVMGPFTVASQMCGPQEFCVATLEDPDMVEALLDKVIDAEVQYMKEMEKILGSLHHILVCDDISAFLSANGFEEFVKGTYDRLFAEFPNTQRWLHNDANAKHLAKFIPDCGFKAWQYGPCMTGPEAAELTRNEVTLLGGFKPLELAKWSVEETEERTNKLIDEFAGNPRLVISAMGSVNQVPIENLLKVLHVADERKI